MLNTLTGQEPGWFEADEADFPHRVFAIWWDGTKQRVCRNGIPQWNEQKFSAFRRLIEAPEPPPAVKAEERVVVDD